MTLRRERNIRPQASWHCWFSQIWTDLYRDTQQCWHSLRYGKYQCIRVILKLWQSLKEPSAPRCVVPLGEDKSGSDSAQKVVVSWQCGPTEQPCTVLFSILPLDHLLGGMDKLFHPLLLFWADKTLFRGFPAYSMLLTFRDQWLIQNECFIKWDCL